MSVPDLPENIVEVPLDSEYLTPDGMYMAGYLWGRHIRSPESAPKGAPPEFVLGAEDGYGDGVAKWDNFDTGRIRESLG